MEDEIYTRLAAHLDNLPAGYPKTQNGVELRILRQIFTPMEAALSLHLTLIAESAKVIAYRAKQPIDEVASLLEQMERNGLIYAYHQTGKKPTYQALGFVIGIYEFQLNRMTPQLAKDCEEYASSWLDLEHWKKVPQLRTIPVNESINVQHEILPYEQADKIVASISKIAVAPCVCRREKTLIGEGCRKPSEVCLIFDKAAEYYIRNGLGREIDTKQALGILKSANRSGLVLQPGNSKHPMSICACCGCCCGILSNIKRHPKPASIVSTPYVAILDEQACDGCGLCQKRCQMDAIKMDDDNAIARLDPDRCIGCGLCVSTCFNDAIELQRKPKFEQSSIPKNSVDEHIKLGQARGKLKNGDLVSMVVKSKLDRLLALK